MSRSTLLASVVVVAWAAPAAAQVDPLLFLKTAPPNVVFMVDTSSRMQRDAAADPSTPATSRATSNYYDPIIYSRKNESWEDGLGLTLFNTNAVYRRRYANLDFANVGFGDKFIGTTIQITGDLLPLVYSRFEAPTRLAIARAALHQAVTENRTVARFGLMKMRQTNASLATQGNSGPVAISDLAQMDTETGSILGRWSISRPTVGATNNGASTNAGTVMVPADSNNATINVLAALAKNTRTAGGLLPAGNDDLNTYDTPVKLMLDDAKAEVTRLININNDPACRNTIVVLMVGGGEGTTTAGVTNANLGPASAGFLAIGGNRVPVYVIAIAPPASDVPSLRAIATTSGGQYFEITKAQIDAALTSPAQLATAGASAPAGTIIVPEVVKAVNTAIQHAFALETDFNTQPTALLPYGPSSEFQVTSPIIGTVNLDNARDINGVPLSPNSADVLDRAGVKIPQRSNLMVTTAFAMPGFDGKLRGFRVYRPEVDSTKASGYKFVSDGKALWVACVPGTGCAEPDPDRRNLYTALADGTMIALTSANAPTLAPLMNLSVADAAAVIESVRALPMGPLVSSTPAIMNPPSLDPPPDDTYPGFAAANAKRRTIVWVGTNYGILEAIDARFGVEVWGFVPHNLLPKLKTLRDGQPVGSFDYFVDSSAKLADVRYDGAWHTHLIIGEGSGGTFYQSFDVTMDDMSSVLGGSAPDSDASLSDVLQYFADPSRIRLNWSFPSYTKFDATIAPYGDISASATAIEKTVGQTWSDPAVGQVFNTSGPYSVMVGSGFLPYSQQQQANRGGVVAGTTFYILNVKDGSVYSSRDVSSDNINETVDDCRTNGDGCKKIKNALQSDPVATGPTDSRFVTKSYIGDLDGNLWRFDMNLDGSDNPNITGLTKLYAAGSDQPIFNSMATVNVGGTKQYVFFGTGSDLLPQTDKNTVHRLLAVLDNGASGAKTFERLLAKTGNTLPLTTDERVTAFPAVAGDIVFFTTTTFNALCSPPNANLYAFTFVGGPAYDNTGDNKIGNQDTPLVKTITGQRATAPYIVDQHLVFGTGSEVKMFGDSQDYNNGIGQAGVRILSWREVR
jgi:hypothetical protein